LSETLCWTTGGNPKRRGGKNREIQQEPEKRAQPKRKKSIKKKKSLETRYNLKGGAPGPGKLGVERIPNSKKKSQTIGGKHSEKESGSQRKKRKTKWETGGETIEEKKEHGSKVRVVKT